MKILISLFFLSITMPMLAQDIPTWRGLKIVEENRCIPYNRSQDYPYSQSIEKKIVESLGNKIYSPYTGRFFESTKETDIEHIISLSEAHDSGLCAANEETKVRFASDLRNLTLASPEVNRDQKGGSDASEWLPEKNKCWYANQIVKVKKAYELTVDSNELIALEKVISKCPSFKLIFFEKSSEGIAENKNSIKEIREPTTSDREGPNVKKSRSGICHARESSPYYSATKNFSPFNNLNLCLQSGGRCPKKDSQCNNTGNQALKKQEKITQESHSKNNKIVGISSSGGEPNIKKSKSGICHAKNSSPHYARTKNFSPFVDLASCLKSGGRCPKRDSRCNNLKQNRKKASMLKRRINENNKVYSNYSGYLSFIFWMFSNSEKKFYRE